jgi:hypothetical protein
MVKNEANCETGEVNLIELTVEEITEREALAEQVGKEVAQREAEAQARATQKAALLDRLGITEEEAKLLLA